MAKRKLDEINAGSMADIAFLLLIFFLVTTTMDTDAGMIRRLPPPLPEDVPPPPPIKDRNVLVILVNSNNMLLVEGEPMDISQLKATAKEFIVNPGNSGSLPEWFNEKVDYFGETRMTKHVISLQNDRGTSYETYIQVQNELAAAYNELREEISMKQFGKHYLRLVKDSRIEENADMVKAIEKCIPQRISEAEPNQ